MTLGKKKFSYSRAAHDLRRLRGLLGRSSSSSSSRREVSRADDKDTERLTFQQACVWVQSLSRGFRVAGGGSVEQQESSGQQRITGPLSNRRERRLE